ncbi:MAG: hypothetical protein KF895_02915 [Parvibaculum sp.]|nr:hypothetical protein [Parvibaculum sp.]
MAALPQAPQSYDPAEWQKILTQIETMMTKLAQPAATGYQVTNGTQSRTFDADTTDLAETNDVLATLIDDLKQKGCIA